jgi:hypothetical protein
MSVIMGYRGGPRVCAADPDTRGPGGTPRARALSSCPGTDPDWPLLQGQRRQRQQLLIIIKHDRMLPRMLIAHREDLVHKMSRALGNTKSATPRNPRNLRSTTFSAAPHSA